MPGPKEMARALNFASSEESFHKDFDICQWQSIVIILAD